MRAAAKTRRIGATVAILTWPLLAAATSAFAQDAPAAADPGRDVVNGQVQLGDVFAGQTLAVVDAQQTVNQATAVGNAATATGAGGGLSFTSQQAVSGAVTAAAATTATGSSGDYAGLTSSATGNTATASTCCGRLSGLVTQNAGDAAVQASAAGDFTGPVGQISADAVAVGDTQGWIAQNGGVAQSTTQTLTGPVSAVTTVNAGVVAGESGLTATAVGNDVTLRGSGSSVEGYTTQTTTGGAVQATLTSQQQAGDTIVGQATATGDNVTVATDGPYATNDHAQTNAAAVTADAAYGVGQWNSASVGAYGVGNSVAVSAGAAPTTEMHTDQTNSGDVAARSSLLTGGAGGDAYVSATAVGNAVQGFACATCEGGVGAVNAQTSYGSVKAVSTYKGAYGGAVTGTSSAVGNTATYVVRGSGS